MSNDHEIVPVNEIEIKPADDGLHPLVQAMIERNPSIEDLRALMALQRDHEAHQAKKAFDAARVRLLEDMPPMVSTDRRVDIRGGAKYRYASLPHIMEVITPALRRHGFAVSWRTSEEGHNITVTCLLSYCGHDEKCSRTAPPDNKGGKSAVQSSQSTVTYLQRHTLLSLLGVVTGDAPDADEPPRPSADTIDPSLTLRAITGLRRRGIPIDDAEDHIGKPTSKWTVGDYATLKTWVAEAAK